MFTDSASYGALWPEHRKRRWPTTSRLFRGVHNPPGYASLAACALAVVFGERTEAALIAAVIVTRISTISVLESQTHRELAAACLPTTVRTPLIGRMARLCDIATLTALGFAAAIFMIGALRGQPAAAHPAAMALLVALVPMQLPAVTAAVLAAGATRMARRGALVRDLSAVETIGAATVVCTGKTGLLTENRITVTSVIADGRAYDATGVGYGPEGEIRAAGVAVPLGENAALDECLLAGVACNDSRITRESGRWRLIGDPTEGALLTSAAKAGIEKADRRLDTLPFAPDRRFMATLHRVGTGEPGVVYVKGAVERVLYLCESRLDVDGRRSELDRNAVHATARSLGRRGLRVLAFAHAEVPPEVHGLTEDGLPRLVFLGLQAMYDPPRPRTVDAVRACQDMDVMVKMITGDDAVSAQASAAWLGLDGQAIMTGADLTACRDDQRPEVAARTDVFARVSPEERSTLVRALRSRNHVVAVTGDSADGTRVTIGSTGLFLIENDLASAAAAVAEGRTVRDNLAKIAVHTLSANLALAVVLFLAAARDLVSAAPPRDAALGVQQAAGVADAAAMPIGPVQVLWLSMIAMVTCLPFAVEPAARRTSRTSSLPGSAYAAWILLATGILTGVPFGLFQWEQAHGATLAQAGTVAVNAFAFLLTANLLSRRSSDPRVAVAAATVLVLQLACTYLPALNDLFGTVPVDGASWLAVIAVTVAYVALLLVRSPLGRPLSARTRTAPR
jgi:cation-transporting ATPase F